ncbi:MAG: hypothetical protein J6C30_07935 [Lentisphaeria bacterium]|nr:hypothetical protein [Lentisphaeria bacterium]
MQIRNYYYKEADQVPVIVGTHTISVPAAWCVWRDQLCSYPEKTAFFDIPAGSDERIILLALPGTTYRRIMFSVSLQEIRKNGAVQALYDSLLTIDPDMVAEAIENQSAFELELKREDCNKDTSVPVSYSELNGLQLIGNTRQSLRTVARMLPENGSDEFLQTYFLAVNPPCYNDSFTTVVSDEMPDGEWKKLKTEHTDYSNAAMFHDRRHSWIRKHQRPRIVMQILFFLVVLLAMGVVCMHFLRMNQALAKENQQLKEKNKQLEFEMQRILHTSAQ